MHCTGQSKTQIVSAIIQLRGPFEKMLWRSLRSPLRGPSIIFYTEFEDILLEVLRVLVCFVCWCAGVLVLSSKMDIKQRGNR